jgi:hypothetical protein
MAHAALPRLAAALALVLASAGPAAAQGSNERFKRECADWISKKGYSSDYIEQRTGSKPAGDMAGDWMSNIATADVKPGDVVLLYVDSVGGRGKRAEVVEEVLRNADGSVAGYRTSSMNIGRMVEPQCHVTENFGKVSTRRVAADRVVGAWRAPAR